jgi:hypothetical protein
MVEDDYRADFRPAKDSSDKNAAPSQSSGSSRVKAKRFMKEKGPEIARAAVTIGVLVLNAVTFCC